MDYLSCLLLLCLTWALVHFFTHNILGRKSPPLPPGPRGYPIIGNILELGKNPHKSLAILSKTYGPIMSLKLGSQIGIVITSKELAKEVLQDHDQALAGRTVPDAVRATGHDKNAMVWVDASNIVFRSQRKFINTQMFTVQKLDSSSDLRQKMVQQLLDFVHENCKKGQAIEIGATTFTTSLNLLSNTFFSIDLASYKSNAAQTFKNAVLGVMEEAGKPNFSDYFPILRHVDPQGIRRRTKVCYDRLIEAFEGIIKERLKQRSISGAPKVKRDVLDNLLDITGDGDSFEFSFHGMRHMLINLFIGGTDTTSKIVEWGMAELLRHPEKLARIKKELKQVDAVRESDLHKFPYLNATVKEMFRLYPPAPFLVPHNAETEVEIAGYRIPKRAQIFVNIWAIGRDPSIWKNPDTFEPERFLDSHNQIDVKGRDFELLPFGSGRRICPGMPLAYRTVPLILGSLLHSFDWKLEDGSDFKDMDMTEIFGVTLCKVQPLRVIPYIS